MQVGWLKLATLDEKRSIIRKRYIYLLTYLLKIDAQFLLKSNRKVICALLNSDVYDDLG